MPNKTIYVKEADLSVWNQAQERLGDSISSIVIECLKERLEESRARKGRRTDEVEAMKTLLAEINEDLKLDVELDPFWRYPILDPCSTNHGFKLHQRAASSERIMSFVVSPQDFDRSGRATPELKERISAAIQSFWDGQRAETHSFFNLAE